MLVRQEIDTMAKARIMIVEDDAIIAEDLKMTVERLGYEVVAMESKGEAAMRRAEESKPDLILMDIMLKGVFDGIEATAFINVRLGIPVIYVTAYSGREIKSRAEKTDHEAYIIKPFNDQKVAEVIGSVLGKA
jgi:CheY-like chemotaxis protein